MVAFNFKNVCLEAFAINTPPLELSSSAIEDKLAPLYNRLGLPFGTLEKLSGVKTRRLWDRDMAPSQAATVAARDVLQQIDFDPALIQALFSCSVTRDYFEPATACLVHRNLGLAEDSIAMDISNACVGFSSGLITLAGMIESGALKAGLLVSAETVSCIIDSSTELILGDANMSRDQLLRLLPTFTLGSGAVAYVLCHKSISKSQHRIVSSTCRSASEFNDLCNGNKDYSIVGGGELHPLMSTESSKLISAAAKLGGRTWKEASKALGWSSDDVDHIFCHQVGKQVNEAFYNEMGLDLAKEFTIYKSLGNLVSAAMPTALAIGSQERALKSGDKVLLTGFGSGLNAVFTGIEW